MSLCCNTPYLTRIEKIKENKESAVKAEQNTAQENADNYISAMHTNNTNNGPGSYPFGEYAENNAGYPVPVMQNSAPPPAIFDVMNVLVGDDSNSSVGHFPKLPREKMMPVVNPVYVQPGNNGSNSPDRQTPSNVNMPTVTPVYDVIPEEPVFEVPDHPLRPPGYSETLDYTSIQYLNGFYRTQIGRYVRVEYQVSSNDIEHLQGFLIGVGINYIIVQDPITSDVTAIDSYSIKTFNIYYTVTKPLFEI